MLFDYPLDEIESGKDTIVFWFHYKYLKFEEDAIQTLHYDEIKRAEALGYYSKHDILEARERIELEAKPPHKYLHPPE